MWGGELMWGGGLMGCLVRYEYTEDTGTNTVPSMLELI